MKVKWLGHATFLVTSNSGTTILIDPYEAGGYNNAIGYGPISEEADVVLVTHEHGDHNNVKAAKGNPTVIRGVGTHSAKGLTFKGVATYHDKSQGKERGPNTVFIFEVDGVNVCHAGDLGHLLTEEQVKEIGEVDLFLVPVGGRATLDAQEATDVAAQIKARVIVPMHFKTPKLGFPFAPVDDFLQGKSNVRRAGSAEIELKKEGLPASPEVVVMDYAL